MENHYWSKPLITKNRGKGYKCKKCLALVEGANSDFWDKPSRVDLIVHKIPDDCNESAIMVIHESYKPWDENTFDRIDFRKYEWE